MSHSRITLLAVLALLAAPSVADGAGQRWVVHAKCSRGFHDGVIVEAPDWGTAARKACDRECTNKWIRSPKVDSCKPECMTALREEGPGGKYFGKKSCRYSLRLLSK